MTQKLKILKLIHLAICTGVILAYIFAGQITVEQLKGQEIKSSDLIYLVIPIAAFLLSNFMFKNQLKHINPDLKLEEKFTFYQTASIIRWAILETAAFLILFIKPALVIFGILLIGYIFLLRPSEDKTLNDLQANAR